VLGRANDLVHDMAGNTVHSEFFTHLFREDPDIAAFQVLYDAAELVVIVRAPRAVAASERYLARIGEALLFKTIRFLSHDSFICIANGKHRFVMRVDSVARTLASGPPVTLRTAEIEIQKPKSFPL
jgi:phenylacetate-CoA ligase